MTALQSSGGHIVDPTEWPFAAPTLVVPAIDALDSSPIAQVVEIREPAEAAASDAELGEILVRVQQFASETEEEAKREAQIIVDSARTEARLIIAGAEQSAPTVIESARVEARRIIEEASGLASRSVSEAVESARAEARRILEQARDQALQLAPGITEAARAEAQRTVEQAKEQATIHARGIIESARAEAQRIVEEASRINPDRASAAHTAVSSEAVVDLTTSIKEFADTNGALVEELIRLRDSLAQARGSAEAVALEAEHRDFRRSPNSQLFGDLHAMGTPRN